MSRNGLEKGKPAPENVLVHRQALAMRAAGKPTREIVLATGVQRPTVNKWLREATMERRA